jgi:hypothetical protein
MERVLSAWNEHFVHAGLPRTLSRQLRDAGFTIRQRDVIPMFNPEYRENTYGKGSLEIMAQTPGLLNSPNLTSRECSSSASIATSLLRTNLRLTERTQPTVGIAMSARVTLRHPPMSAIRPLSGAQRTSAQRVIRSANRARGGAGSRLSSDAHLSSGRIARHAGKETRLRAVGGSLMDGNLRPIQFRSCPSGGRMSVRSGSWSTLIPSSSSAARTSS